MNTEHMQPIVDVIESQRTLLDLVEQLADKVHGTGTPAARAVQTELVTHRESMTKAREHFARWV